MKKLIKRNKLRILTLVTMIFALVITGNIGEQSRNIFVDNTVEAASSTVKVTTKNKVKYATYNGKKYKILSVAGGNMSGKRKANVAVDIGYGSRLYWGFTNSHGQLVYVVADKVTLQNPKKEKVLSNGRYYKDEAKVPGTERKDLDEGHVIADSLGGVSNAYNITPQDSTLNRHGDQAYMENTIRKAKGCTSFRATITYPNSKTQIPTAYKYSYKIKGKTVKDSFKNVNPDKVNKPIVSEQKNLAKVDKNGNCKVTIAEAKAAGYKMPITKKHWLYKYMTDSDGDGMVGE